eukprot:m.28898 g.28898  ORF g.28898 m.28898 type:complete len:240 (+) comp11894_c0_seq1:65-784(+)
MYCIEDALVALAFCQRRKALKWLHFELSQLQTSRPKRVFFGPVLSKRALTLAIYQLLRGRSSGNSATQQPICLRCCRMLNVHSERQWYRRLNAILSFEITLDRLANYISTFGGAYSQLGQEQWMKAVSLKSNDNGSTLNLANVGLAGQSMDKQATKLYGFATGALHMASNLLRIAQLKHDEHLATRCNLFAAQACLQLGNHRAARRLLKMSYPACRRLSSGQVCGLYSSVRAKYLLYAV